MSQQRCPSFLQSLRQYASYPSTLVSTSTAPRSQRLLDEYRKHLEDSSDRLFVNYPEADPLTTTNPNTGILPNGIAALDPQNEPLFNFRDFRAGSNKVHMFRVNNEAMLQQWLDLPSEDTDVLKKADPVCRFIFISALDSRKELQITKNMMCKLLAYHQVMPCFLDLLFAFGKQYLPRDQQYSRFTFESYLGGRGERNDFLGRSGDFYQMCYNLKAVEHTPSQDHMQYRIRPAAVYHSLDNKTGNTVWLTVKGNNSFKDMIQELTGKSRPENRTFESVGECLQNSFAVQEMLAEWSTSNWRRYISLWEENLTEKTATLLTVAGSKSLAMLARENPRDDESYYTFKNLQDVQYIEDHLNEAVSALKANSKIIHDMKKCYARIMSDPQFNQTASAYCQTSYDTFQGQLSDIENQYGSLIETAALVQQRCSDRKRHIQALIQHEASARMQLMTDRMKQIADKTNKETIVMRVITLVALFLLPGTFVSSFFSTDVLKYDNNEQKYSSKAMEMWSILTAALLIFTVAASAVIYWRSMKQLKDDEENLLKTPTWEG